MNLAISTRPLWLFAALGIGCASSQTSSNEEANTTSTASVATSASAQTSASNEPTASTCYCGNEPGCPPCANGSASATPASLPEAAGTFPPANFSAPVERTAQSGDGTWVPLAVHGATKDDSPLVTTLVHPHSIRAFVVTQIVAIDTSRVSMDFVVGNEEPEGSKFPLTKRTGLVPDDARAALIAVTNGGFKKRHGGHGLGVGGEIVLEPSADFCTFMRRKDGRYEIGTHSAITRENQEFDYFRQTPPCLVENGVKHPDLADAYKAKKWGGAEDGNKEIRRSAIGIGKDPRILYFAIADYSTAEWLADALVAAGITQAAELDINYSYTRFIVYEHKGDQLIATSPLLEKLKAPSKEYVKTPSGRDFFYLRWIKN